MAEKLATREAYGKALAALGQKYPELVVLDADLAAATKTATFQKAFPERFIDCGIAEGNMMLIAAGLSTTGKIPFASTFAMFAAGRAFEQIRNGIGYPHLNVKIGATHAGITVGEDGATHQCLEDLALMRTIPGMVVLNPADATEAAALTEAALLHNGPVYLRYGRAPVPVLFGEDYRPEIGRGVVLCEGTDATVIATGYMVHVALEAKDALAGEGISVRVVNMHTIKPLDTALVAECAEKTGAIVTAEEHSVIGGLGSAVCEAVCEGKCVPVVRVGTQDCFGRSGKVAPLLEYYGLTAQGICDAVKRAISKK